MKNRFGLVYYDRASGELLTERVFAAGFLYWSYNSRPGRALTRWVLSRPWVSRLCGWLARCRASRHLIIPFARRMQVAVPPAAARDGNFTCFHDFFVRDLEWAARKDFGTPSACLSPVDGKVLVLRDLAPGETFRVKRSIFNLEGLLADRRLAERFSGGTAAIFRLGLADNHHFHFPVAGVPRAARAIPGRLYAGGPYALRTPTAFYAENFRMVTLIDSDRFGPVIQVEIGAFTVGCIRQRYLPGRHVEKGEAKGNFELGGSTVVLLFTAGALEIDADLRRYSSRDIETRVSRGDPIGCIPGTRFERAGHLMGSLP